MYKGYIRVYIEGANEITRSSAKRHPKFMNRVISVILFKYKSCYVLDTYGIALSN